MEFNAGQIRDILGCGGQIVSPLQPVLFLLTDSRRIFSGEDSLFIALRGPHYNGHQYIEQAYSQGVRNFLVENISQTYSDANFFLVEDSLAALQALAAACRKRFNRPVIGLTGSNGKTIVKEWMYHLLKMDHDVVRSPKSYNSQLGVPLSLWNLELHHDLAIIEAGISMPGEMDSLEAMIHPEIGVFTHLGPAHNEGFQGDQKAKAREKAKLFRRSQVVIYRSDISDISESFKEITAESVRWSLDTSIDAEWYVSSHISGANNQIIHLSNHQNKYELDIPFADEASMENAVNAFLACLQLNTDPEVLIQQARSFPAVSMRLELLSGINNCQLINDVYSADPGSLTTALHFLDRQSFSQGSVGREKCVILSDMDGSGLPADELYKRLASTLHSSGISRMVGIGTELISCKSFFGLIPSEFYPDTQAFLKNFKPANWKDAIILVKGARRFRLEQVVEALELKLHNTELQVNLSNMVHNLHVYRSLLPQGVRIMAMVKAFGYGSGAAEVAGFLAYHKVDYLAVAYADEGLELRRNGIHLPIMVMNPEPSAFRQLMLHDLEPEIFSLEQLQGLLEVAGGETLKVHIKLETGMNRLGFREKEIPALIALIKSHPEIIIQSVFSHLSSADLTEEDTFTREQINQFQRLSNMIQEATGAVFLRHILNSPGIAKFPEACFDMVRLGIGLYGDDPTESVQQRLLPVSTLLTSVAMCRNIEPGESVGYGRSFIASQPMRIAILNIGYADGLRRSMGNGKGSVWINGSLAPIVGRVCMDMCMVDITTIHGVQAGTVAEIFGAHIPLRHVAAIMGTIPYEVLTGISQRVRRVYVEE